MDKMTQEQADFIESVALTVEANPEFYKQSIDPGQRTETSCGCLLHFAVWMSARPHAAWDGWTVLQGLMGLDKTQLRRIYGWLPCPPVTSAEGAAYLRTYIPSHLKG